MSELTKKHCVPCEGGVPSMTRSEIENYRPQISAAWHVVDDKKIEREFSFASFKEAMQFVNAAADLAETEGHHPDIYIYFKRVRLELTTHAIKGLSENDFIMAAKIDALPQLKRG